jgi:hypothetical protein
LPHDRAHAEAAFLVADPMQGRGVGTRLLEQLAVHARDRGIHTFHTCVMGGNHRMLQVFADSGFTTRSKTEHGVLEVVLSLDETPALRSKLADPHVDALLTIFIPPLVTAASDVAVALREVARTASKPVVATFIGVEGAIPTLAPVPIGSLKRRLRRWRVRARTPSGARNRRGAPSISGVRSPRRVRSSTPPWHAAQDGCRRGRLNAFWTPSVC